MHETEKIERKKNLKKKMSLRNCSNHLLFLKLFSQTLLLLDRIKDDCSCFHVDHWTLFLRKELQILYEVHKIAFSTLKSAFGF